MVRLVPLSASTIWLPGEYQKTWYDVKGIAFRSEFTERRIMPEVLSTVRFKGFD